MAGYAKVFDSILTSSLWCKDHHVLRIWIAMLARCNSQGVVEGSIPGFASLCRVTDQQMEEAVQIFTSPDPYSRTPDFEGRRIEVIPGGWRILNYKAYRAKGQEKEGSKAPFMRALRESRKAEQASEPKGNVLPNRVTGDPAATAAAVHHPPSVSGVAAGGPASAQPLALPMAKGLWTPSQELLLRWQGAFPGVDVLGELGRIQAYLREHPKVRFGEARLVPWVEEWLAKEAKGKAGGRSRAAPRGGPARDAAAPQARPQAATIKTPKLERLNPGGTP